MTRSEKQDRRSYIMRYAKIRFNVLFHKKGNEYLWKVAPSRPNELLLDTGGLGCHKWRVVFCRRAIILRAYPDNRVVMRPSEKSEAKAAGQKGSEAWFAPR